METGFGKRRKQEVQVTAVLVEGWRLGKSPRTEDKKRNGWL